MNMTCERCVASSLLLSQFLAYFVILLPATISSGSNISCPSIMIILQIVAWVMHGI
ncbi:hypothetical protein LPH45_02510 [Xylella taiwanensis]|nr:hypothetical protein [Xylella taiwanensis]UFN02775.1 hypothetical protein LPH43_02680 [Xylella taiwanensis]UFN07245.1 hypothetical protein LPH42_02465 [Xylella taiwanensis]UFN09544.1 hypothetical protein LPH45_02510 [Xylella taiwanensis]UFN14125.1 hypothetical protein LPH61_02475 [Xylella taiwanensis]UFN25422.1 hypothetical protein LPH62_02690 [Xylella taiwanensis]